MIDQAQSDVAYDVATQHTCSCCKTGLEQNGADLGLGLMESMGIDKLHGSMRPMGSMWSMGYMGPMGP